MWCVRFARAPHIALFSIGKTFLGEPYVRKELVVNTTRDVTLEEAKKILEGALEYAEERGMTMSFAVVERLGNLVAVHKMDNASILFPDWAIRKAFTASSFATSTTALADRIMTNKMSYAFYLKSDPRLMYIKGGIPIVEGEECIGAVGVSGGTDEQDEECAEAALRHAGFVANP